MKEGSFSSTYKKRRSAKKLPTSTIFIVGIAVTLGYLLLIFCTDKMYNIKSSDIAVVSVSYDHSRDNMIETVASARQSIANDTTNNVLTVPETYSGKYKDKNFAKAYNILVDLGWQNTQICAVLGNLCAEAGDSPSRADLNPLCEYKGHKGIAQWDSTRYSRMQKFCKDNNYDPDKIEGQTMFLAHEATDPKGGQDFRVKALKNPDSFPAGNADAHTKLPDNFWETDDLDKATKAFALCFEGCVMTESTINSSQEGLQSLYDRQRFARECWEIFVEGKE